jgi:simple sugar transport system substrate-binding protein/ribose transport system substrate-binding protein
MDLSGEVVHVGHDLETETLSNIKDGATNASLSQDPFKQGYEAVRSLYNYIQAGVVPKDIDTGVLRVDEANIDAYLQKLEEGEPIG